MEMIQRPRRLRRNPVIRSMVRETRVSPDSLIYPLFVCEGKGIRHEIPSLPGQYHYSVDTLQKAAEETLQAGVHAIMLFGLPGEKDEKGSGAYAENGVIQRAVRELKKNFSELFVITDVCLCEYTSHGHCGMLRGCEVDNDATLPLLAKTALSHVQAGADMVAPSDMMDGRVAAIRRTLDIPISRFYPMRLNTPRLFTGLSERPPDQPRHLATGKAIRWISTIDGKPCGKRPSMWRRALIS